MISCGSGPLAAQAARRRLENPRPGDEGDDRDHPIAGLDPSDHVHLAILLTEYLYC
jgi:hypothetical protein